ncbi:unnamed protein product [Arctogadus glacialis]
MLCSEPVKDNQAKTRSSIYKRSQKKGHKRSTEPYRDRLSLQPRRVGGFAALTALLPANTVPIGRFRPEFRRLNPKRDGPKDLDAQTLSVFRTSGPTAAERGRRPPLSCTTALRNGRLL